MGKMTKESTISPRGKWLRLLYLLPLVLLLPPVFTPAVNLLTNFLNWTDKVFGWDWHALAFAIMRWLDPTWNPGA